MILEGKDGVSCRGGRGGGSKERAYFTRPSGIMEISGARKQEAVSALVESIRAKARAKRASHLELFGVLRNGTDQGVVGGDQAEATRRHLMNPLGVEAARKKNKGEPKPIGSSRA